MHAPVGARKLTAFGRCYRGRCFVDLRESNSKKEKEKKMMKNFMTLV